MKTIVQYREEFRIIPFRKLEQLYHERVHKAMEGNLMLASKVIDMPRQTLSRKWQQYGLAAKGGTWQSRKALAEKKLKS